ncbi:MAG TPA: JAB domain-containing protein [Candidatus Dormibacteraeota bacterium]|nr:JAB domain-containing protein [Candidatus Dormibacteraeota bacterium]
MQPSRRPLEVVDDRVLVHDLLGTAAARRVAHVAVPALLEADADQLGRAGLPPAARRRLLAAGELARRFQPASRPPPGPLDRPEHFLAHLARLRAAPVEVLGVLTLDSRLSLVGDFQAVAGGALMHVTVTPREVFATAVERRAAAIVLAHNHPSGDPQPSPDDRLFTQLMARAGAVLGIQLLDHLVVTRRAYFSFAEARLLGAGGGVSR